MEGAPEVVVEVFANDLNCDLRKKKALYEKAGVLEYVLVDPLENYVMRFLLTDDGYDKGKVFACHEFLLFELLNGLQSPLGEVVRIAATRACRSILGVNP